MTKPDRFSPKLMRVTSEAPVKPELVDGRRTARVVRIAAITMTTRSRTRFSHCWIMTRRYAGLWLELIRQAFFCRSSGRKPMCNVSSGLGLCKYTSRCVNPISYVLTKSSQCCNPLYSINKMRAKQECISIGHSNRSVHYRRWPNAYYKGLFASRSNNLSCREVRR